ncbi:dynein axonemal heavy chain 5-like, partial [Cherax quadricarinatus]|uniref:dynein axonemal heavy chain 5-like n=1 Tax=Cherax quadricarinatus TaxID=27406 RepID=UPI00387E76AF
CDLLPFLPLTPVPAVALLLACHKQKRREEQERRARRGDTDPRYEYIFQVLAACTGIARHQVMDYVFEENLLEEISKFLMPGQYNNMIWFYQECDENVDDGTIHEEDDTDTKLPSSPLLSQPSSGASRRSSTVSGPTEMHQSRRNSTATEHTEDGEPEPENSRRMRLFVGSPRTTPLTGLCICMTRTTPQRTVTEENVHREVNFMLVKAGDDPAVLLRSVQRLLSRVFVPAVRVNPSDVDTWPGSVSARDHLLAGLRSFASCLHVSESIMEERVVLAALEEGVEEVRGDGGQAVWVNKTNLGPRANLPPAQTDGF